MIMEPMTIFARIADAAGVARLLREREQSVVFDGADHDWRSATVSFESAKLTFTHDPEYHAEPNWSIQMDGMRGYYAQFPESEAKKSAMMLTTTFKFSLGLLFEPHEYIESDARFDLIFAVTTLLDGVIFTPSALLDAKGRVLFRADGEEDYEAVWPRVLAEIAIDTTRQEGAAAASPPGNGDLATPTPERVARRALALTAVTARALLEQDGVLIRRPKTAWWKPRNWLAPRENQRRELLEWIKLVGVDDEIEPNEWEVLQRPIDHLEPGQQIDSTWRLEGLVVLAWALRRFQLPPHDTLVSPHPLLASLDVFDAPAAKALLVQPALRPRSEIDNLRGRLFALHWRLTDFRIQPRVIHFTDFARTAWFGPLDLNGLPLIENDLAVAGKRIDKADADALATANSIAVERHMAINWLWEGPLLYSEARIDT
jgi:hypothetical protein